MSKRNNVDNFDQTAFAQAVAMEHKQAVDLTDQEVSLEAPQRRNWIVLVSIVAVLIIIIIGLVLTLSLRDQQPVSNSNPEQQELVQNELTPIDRELLLLERNIAEADPLQSSLAFPPVNFELELEDATVRQQVNY